MLCRTSLFPELCRPSICVRRFIAVEDAQRICKTGQLQDPPLVEAQPPPAKAVEVDVDAPAAAPAPVMPAAAADNGNAAPAKVLQARP